MGNQNVGDQNAGGRDETLAENVANPARACIAPQTLAALVRSSEVAIGAVAMASGPSIARIDAFLPPLLLPVAGIHGIGRRNAAGLVASNQVDAGAQHRLVVRVGGFVDGRPGLLAEVKPGSVALHCRKRPEREA